MEHTEARKDKKRINIDNENITNEGQSNSCFYTFNSYIAFVKNIHSISLLPGVFSNKIQFWQLFLKKYPFNKFNYIYSDHI